MGNKDVRLLCRVLSLARSVLIITRGLAGIENLPESTRTGCGTRSDVWHPLAKPEGGPFRSASDSTVESQSGAGVGEVMVISGGTVVRTLTSPTCAMRLPGDSEVANDPSVCVGCTWKDTWRVLIGKDTRDKPSGWTSNPTSSERVGSGDSEEAICVVSCSGPMMMMGWGELRAGVSPM